MDHSLSTTALAVVAACFVIWGLVSARLERLNITAPIAFVAMGLAVTHGPLTVIHLDLHSETIRSLAELTLALVLFADASRVNAKALRADLGVPLRLLGIGLPLTIGAGAAIALGLFGGSGVWLAATIGAVVAPTDAALGASVMEDRRVPGRVRRILNVESGLNDGIATPFVNLFLAGALSAEAIHSSGVGTALLDLVVGAAIGAGIGLASSVLLALAGRIGWSAPSYRPLAILAVALLAYTGAVEAHTNGFVAAFIAGLVFGSVAKIDREALSFTEEAGVLMSLLVWFIFGGVMLVPGLEDAGWRDIAFALLALTVARMVPVALALIGSGLDRATVGFVGWFGPRGLASVVFGLIAVDSLAPADAHVMLGAVTVTVLLSVLLHGVSASPLARRYGLAMHPTTAGRPEHEAVPELSARSLSGDRHVPLRGGRT